MHRPKPKQIDRQTEHIQIDLQTERLTDRQIYRQIETQTEHKQIDSPNKRQIDIQTKMNINRYIYRHINIQTQIQYEGRRDRRKNRVSDKGRKREKRL